MESKIYIIPQHIMLGSGDQVWYLLFMFIKSNTTVYLVVEVNMHYNKTLPLIFVEPAPSLNRSCWE